MDGDLITHVAKQGPFSITVTERGTLESQSNVVLSSSVQGKTTIISIVPEGTEVEKDQVVCVLDSSSLVEKERQQQITLSESQSKLQKAIEDVDIQKNQNESDLSKAQLDLELAKLDLEKYIKGEAIQEKNELQSNIALAEEKLIQSEEDYQFTKRMSRKGYKTLNEVETARIAASDAQIKLDIAKGKFNVMDKYTYKRTIKELEEKLKEAKREIVRVEQTGLSALKQYESELESRRQTIQVEEDKLNKYREQIEKCELRAPQPGQVVYNTPRRRRNEGQAIEEGATVYEQQTIIKLPDFTQMKVDARIHESRIRLLKTKLPVSIKVDALPDVDFRGEVITVSSVPLSPSWMSPNLKEYEAEIKVLGDENSIKLLRPGMTAELEILVLQRDNVLQIPVQAVVSLSTKHFVYVVQNGTAERREIEAGQTNDKMIEVLGGISEGEAVIMNPRTTFAEELQELEEKIANDPTIKKEQAEQAEKRKKENDQKEKKQKSGKIKEMFKNLDKNADGKLLKAELPAPFQAGFDMADTNKDGHLDQAELSAAMKKMRGAR